MSENQSEVISDVTKKVVIETEQDKEKLENKEQKTLSNPMPLKTDELPSASGMTDLREEDEKRRLGVDVKKFIQESQDKGRDLTHNPQHSVPVLDQTQTETLAHDIREVTDELVVMLDKQDTTSMAAKQDELDKIQMDMNRVLDRGFEAVHRPAERTGFWARFKNRVKVGVRWTWAATLGSVISAIGIAIKTPGKVFSEGSKARGAQKDRKTRAVPGREGEVFEDYTTEYDDQNNEQVYSDVRRGPLVWEKLTAGDPEDPPEVCIMVEQSKRGSGAALSSMDMGHAMIGLSYSRYNKSTKRKERYCLQMGFYPKGGMVGAMGTLAMTGGAIMPGQLKDDSGHHYDIARRYQVTPGQINAILREAEHYEDGGYGYYKRNCTTFVVAMANAAHLELAGHLEEDEMVFEGPAGLAVELAEGMSAASYFGAAGKISSRMDKDDINYLTFGQKMVTKEDLDRYYDSALSADVVRKGYSPGALGEVIRSSVEGSYDAKFEEDLILTPGDIGIYMRDFGAKLWDEINKKLPMIKRGTLDDQIRDMLYYEDEKDLGFVIMKEGGPTTQELRDIHKSISKRMKILDKYYRERLDRDADLNATYMQYLSFCEVALSICDRYYRSVVKQDVKGDTAYMKGGYTRLGFHIKATDSGGVETETNIPPGIYEGYLMAGRTPVQAVKEYKEYMELLELGEGHRNGAQESKFRFLDKIHTLAADFASANRYIMWKDAGSYTKNDLNYAFFQLPAMETRHEGNESLEGDLVDKYSASCTYQGVIFENIFEGMKDVDDIAGPSKKRSERIWGLDNYLSRKVQEKPDLMHKIVNCFCENKPDEVSFGIAEYVIESIMRSYVIHVLADLELRKNDISIIETELKAHSAIKTHLTQIAAGIRNEEL